MGTVEEMKLIILIPMFVLLNISCGKHFLIEVESDGMEKSMEVDMATDVAVAASPVTDDSMAIHMDPAPAVDTMDPPMDDTAAEEDEESRRRRRRYRRRRRFRSGLE